MARSKAHSSAPTTATPDQAWTVVRDFSAPWHPAIESMAREQSAGSATIRRFTVTGDTGTYRERLTYFSDSDRTMGYTHLEGIAGAESYDAWLSITAAEQGAEITMRAEITANANRAKEIATGTQAIFDAGTQAVAKLAPDATTIRHDTPKTTHASPDHCKIDGVPELHLTTAGLPSDTLCLFLHGIGGNRSNWTAQLGTAAATCKSAALDLRGYGDSELGPAPSDIDAYCADILRILETQRARRLILCGLSYGAWIATSFAMRHPDLLAGLVLSGGCTGMSEAAPAEREAFRQSREVPLSKGQTPADFAPDVVNIIAGPNATEAQRQSLLTSMQAIPAQTYADALRCFTNPPERFDFSRLTMPVLLMTGEHDRLAPPDEIRQVSHRICTASASPDVRFEVIAGAGHVCNLEQPGAYNRILSEFLSRVVR